MGFGIEQKKELTGECEEARAHSVQELYFWGSMKKRIAIINGPNLNRVGNRENSIYGDKDFATALAEWKDAFPEVEITLFQSNVEGEIIDAIQALQGQADGVLINPGGYTHTSVAIADALRALDIPYIEVHLSNVLSRESYRHTSLTGAAARGIIMGFGMEGYKAGIQLITQN